MDRIKKFGREDILLPDGSIIQFKHDKEKRTSPPPGHTGKGCYVKIFQ